MIHYLIECLNWEQFYRTLSGQSRPVDCQTRCHEVISSNILKLFAQVVFVVRCLNVFIVQKFNYKATRRKSEYSLRLCSVSSISVLCFQYDIHALLFAVSFLEKVLEIYIPPGVQLVTNITTRWCICFPIVK